MRGRALLIVGVLASAAGCKSKSEPIDPGKTSADIAAMAAAILRNAAGGVGFAEQDDSVVQKTGNGFGDALNGLSGVPLQATPIMRAPFADLAPPTLVTKIARRWQKPPGFVALYDTAEMQLNDGASDLEVYLRDRVFVASNLESQSADEAVFLLHPDPTCRNLPSSGNTDLDPSCVMDLTKLEVRAALRQDGDGGRIAWLIGKEKAELFVLVIHSNLLAVESGLAQTKQASDIIDATLGDGPSTGSVTRKLAGRVRVTLSKDGAKKFTASFSILEAIDIEVDEADGTPAIYLESEKRDPLFSATFDGVALTVALTYDIGTTEFHDAWDPMDTGTATNTDFRVRLGGFTGKLTLSDQTDDLTVSGLGLGAVTTQIAVRDKTVMALDLNADAGRKLDLHGVLNPAGLPRWDVTPKLDLALGYHLGLVAAELSTPPEPYLQDETYRLRLAGGGNPTIEAVAEDLAKMFGGGLKVVAGALEISSDKATAPLVVPEGKCLTGNDTPDPAAHPVLGSLRVTDCP